ncbi:helix-turn-helix domain-containing protein [Bacillus cereus]|uniref:helix-turn-helix domain-containing protein n=1 Tax=Bacillus cereus TaxID=1396 RepID=UPI0006ACCBA1|nr:helix-turn-helix domain-containing protein [Bacillus cereus]
MQLQVILSDELNEQLKAEVHSTIMQAVESAKREAGFDKRFLKKVEMAKWCGVSYKTFNEWCNRGLPTILLDGVTLYSKDQVSNWLEEQSI